MNRPTVDGKKRFLWTTLATGMFVLAMMVSTRPAQGQFDLGVVIGMLESVERILNSTVTPIMRTMSSVESNMLNFQQTVLYPVSEISRIKAAASSYGRQMVNIQNLFRVPVNSATLPNTKTLESQLLGGNANNISVLGPSYYQVFGSLPSDTALAPDLRAAVDMNDAQAQDTYKVAVKLDALANTEEQLSLQYIEQLQNTSPGNASLIQAQAAAWNLQAAAYTQQGLAELLRARAADTAYQSLQMKHASATHQQTMQQIMASPFGQE
ncbi:hypothetical protein [Pseudacidobacterium ailaaui]|uniref:hypothetical protein n=1 Tax=Pseudacidobacterium ailaaui TaxID=1382359 RepID=UPI0012DF04F2|nr:hypothetical protein [Pseudacidobacterium ailaaui]